MPRAHWHDGAMKIFAGGIATETNTFSPAPTGLAAYLTHGVHRGAGQADAGLVNEYSPMFDTLRRLAREEGHELVIGLGAYALPGGTTTRAAYETLRDELLGALRHALPVHAVILPLHGAMVADGYPSCESDLVTRVRAQVGPRVPIGVQLDLHCHYTEALRTQATLCIAYKEYPHTDIVSSLEEVWRLTLATARGHVAPVTAVHECRMLGLWHTTREPMQSFVRRMKTLEADDGVLSASFGHGFEFGDVPEAGSKVWVTTDGRTDPGAVHAATLARELAREVWSMREAARTPLLAVDEALDRLLGSPPIPGRPVVLADTADNPGGGAMSDSTFILRCVVEREIGRIALGAFWDLGAVHVCREAGVGATLDLRVGGKCGPASGDPMDLRVTVRGVRDNHLQNGLGFKAPCGPSAWVSTARDQHLVLTSRRDQVYRPDLFTGLGVPLSELDAVVVKSAQHFHAAFAPLAREVLYVDSPGLLRGDFENIAFRHRSLNFWPRVADPWRTPP
jgi:microcystin degradation protein MlrC